MTARQKKVRSFILSVLAVFAGLIFLGWLAIVVLKPGPEGRVVIASGGSEGAYHELALVYQKKMRRYGIEAELRPSTAGSDTLTSLLDIEVRQPPPGTTNLAPTIVDKPSDVDAGFIKGGVAGSLQGRLVTNEERKWHDRQVEALQSVGRLFYEPVWIFYTGSKPVKSLAEFKGRKIMIGSKESGWRRVAKTLLLASGINKTNTTFIEKDVSADAAELVSGQADAAFLVLPPESPTVQKLLHLKSINLMDFSAEADAYVARFPHLTKLVLPQGAIELAPDLPAASVILLSTTATLVVKKTLHPAITAILADTVLDNPRPGFDRDGEPILFHKAGEFPTPKDPEFQVARDAVSIYKTGDLPFILHTVAPLNASLGIPFWVTGYLHKHGTNTLLLLIPILSIALPLAQVLPKLYAWTVRRRVYQWYRQMKSIETRLDHHPSEAQLAEAHAELDRIDRLAGRVKVPSNFSDMFYNLRSHIDLVRTRLQAVEQAHAPAAAE